MASQSRAIRSESQKILKFVKFGLLIFLNCKSRFDLTDLLASIYDRKKDARHFDTIHDIMTYEWSKCVNLAQAGTNVY